MNRVTRTAGRRRALALVLTACLCLASAQFRAGAGETEWRPLLVLRFGNIDAVDAEDGNLVSFLKAIRNDGLPVSPLRALVGPRIRNSTFFGIRYETWMECVVLVPSRPGPTEHLWVFPVDSRDEYMAHLANQGLSEYEGMDGVTVLRETDQTGGTRHWHLEWLPGNILLFGGNRETVVAARQLYAERGAAKGLLAGVGGEYLEPDVMVRLLPRELAAWRDATPFTYWWREKAARLTRDLVAYWDPRPARTRLIHTLADAFAAWPRSLERIDLSAWCEREGVEFRLEVEGDLFDVGAGDLAALRRVPERTALAYAMPVSAALFRRLGDGVGRMLLDAAGGVVTREARTAAAEFFGMLAGAGIREAALGWVSPPAGRPELGAARVLLLRSDRPDRLEEAWRLFRSQAAGDTPAAQAFSQIGWTIAVDPDPETEADMTAGVVIAPASGEGEPYYRASFAAARREDWTVLVAGDRRPDAQAEALVAAYRRELAEAICRADSPGIPGVREAFTRVGMEGASFVGLLDPVRFLQIALIEAADWRPRSPDQPEPLSTQMAREMLEYGSVASWTAAGEMRRNLWRFNGQMTWQSLVRLSAALGVTESVGMD